MCAHRIEGDRFVSERCESFKIGRELALAGLNWKPAVDYYKRNYSPNASEQECCSDGWISKGGIRR